MANKQVVFSDRIAGISIVNGLVRLDLATVTGPAKGKDGKSALRGEVTHQLVMPLDGFMASFAAQQKLVKELVARQQKKGGKAAAAEKTDAPAA